MPAKYEVLILDASDRRELENIARSAKNSPRKKLPALICLKAAEGLSGRRIAKELSTTRVTVSRSLQRFKEEHLPEFRRNLSRRPSPRRLSEALQDQIVEATIVARKERKEADKISRQAQWSTRALGRGFGVSAMTILRTWRENGLDRISVARRKMILDWNRCYIVGLSSERALAVGIAKNVKRELSLAREVLTGHKSSIPNRLNFPLMMFDNPDGPTPKLPEFHRFLLQLLRKAHPELELFVLCHSGLSSGSESISALQNRTSWLHLYYAPQGERWYNWVENWLADMINKRFWIKNWHHLILHLDNYRYDLPSNLVLVF